MKRVLRVLRALIGALMVIVGIKLFTWVLLDVFMKDTGSERDVGPLTGTILAVSLNLIGWKLLRGGAGRAEAAAARLRQLTRRSGKEPLGIRDALFGDMALNLWGAGPEIAEPWVTFAAASRALSNGRTDEGATKLQEILATPDLESRHYLQAWHALRGLGIAPPPDVAKQVLGVVVEVGMKGGLDIVAAYRDLHARYYNYSGGGVVWEHPDASLDPYISDLLASAQPVVDVTAPWEHARPPAPRKGFARINMLTPSGLYFGDGGFKELSADPLGGRVMAAATALMSKLIADAKRPAGPVKIGTSQEAFP